MCKRRLPSRNDFSVSCDCVVCKAGQFHFSSLKLYLPIMAEENGGNNDNARPQSLSLFKIILYALLLLSWSHFVLCLNVDLYCSMDNSELAQPNTKLELHRTSSITNTIIHIILAHNKHAFVFACVAASRKVTTRGYTLCERS